MSFRWATHPPLLLMHQGRRLGFAFKYSDRPSTTKSMRVALQDLGLEHLYAVHPAGHRFPLDDAITAIPLPRVFEMLQRESGPSRNVPATDAACP